MMLTFCPFRVQAPPSAVESRCLSFSGLRTRFVARFRARRAPFWRFQFWCGMRDSAANGVVSTLEARFGARSARLESAAHSVEKRFLFAARRLRSVGVVSERVARRFGD